MNAYICKGCGREWFSAAGLQEMAKEECPECGGGMRLAEVYWEADSRALELLCGRSGDWEGADGC